MPLIGKMIIIGVLIFFVIVTAVIVFGLYLRQPKGKSVDHVNHIEEKRDQE